MLADPVVRYAFFIAAGALLSAVALIVGVAWLRIARRIRLHRQRTLIAKWEPLLYAAATGEIDSVPPVQDRDLPVFLSLWNHLQETLQGDAAADLNRFLIQGGFPPRVQKMMNGGPVSSRLIAITCLGHLREPEAVADLLRIAGEPHPVQSFTAARALLRIDPRKTLPQLMPSMLEREDWPISRLASIFRELGANVVTAPLLAAKTPRDTRQALRFLQLLAQAHQEKLHTALRNWLQIQNDPEVLATALGFLRSAEDLPALQQAARHEDWRVRMAAAKGMGEIGGAPEREILLTLLADSSWWVRYRAAEAIISLPGGSIYELVELRYVVTDQFAADMIDQVLAERQ